MAENEEDFIEYLGKEGFLKLLEYFALKLFEATNKSPDFKKFIWFYHFKNNPSVESLARIMEDGTHKRTKKGELILNEFSSRIFLEVFSAIEDGRDLADIMEENEYVKVLYNFYKTEMPDALENYIWLKSAPSYEVSKDFNKEFPLLIKGYKYYLNHKGEMSDRRLCDEIEAGVIEKVLNVRNDYQNYDNLFIEMERAVDSKLDNNFKLTYLRGCAEPYLEIK